MSTCTCETKPYWRDAGCPVHGVNQPTDAEKLAREIAVEKYGYGDLYSAEPSMGR